MSTMEKQNKWDKRKFKTWSFGEKKGTKELKVSAKPCAEKSITVHECITIDRNSAVLHWNTRKGALETRFYQVRAPITERREHEGFPTPKKQNLGALFRGFTSYLVSSAGGTVWQC